MLLSSGHLSYVDSNAIGNFGRLRTIPIWKVMIHTTTVQTKNASGTFHFDYPRWQEALLLYLSRIYQMQPA